MLNDLYDRLNKCSATMLGYPLDQTPFPLFGIDKFMGLLINNLGDPSVGGTYAVNTFEQEREALAIVADMLHLPKEQRNGYVTSCGTEGNIRGIANGLERFPNAIVYASDKVHYSVLKACRLARAVLIRTNSINDRMDVQDLLRQLRRDCPAVICATVGTVFSGAIDDVTEIINAVKNIVPLYVHVDAALAGLLIPPALGPAGPTFDFRTDIDSLSISGHKMLGCRIPCGVFLTRQWSGDHIDYIDSTDTTIGGSRSGLAALMFWHALKYHGPEGLRQRARECLDIAHYACERIYEADQSCWRASPLSNMVVFNKPPAAIVEKYQLATDGDRAHVICMPHVNRRLIDQFVSELKGEGS